MSDLSKWICKPVVRNKTIIGLKSTRVVKTIPIDLELEIRL